MGRVRENIDSEKRDAAVIRSVLKKVLIALKRLHSLGKASAAPTCIATEVLFKVREVYMVHSQGNCSTFITIAPPSKQSLLELCLTLSKPHQASI